jgi:tRNA-2-methylthio-N6-dimethylallyladenosine synthase
MKYHIWTEGCQMNVADSQRAASALEKMGYRQTGRAEEADVIILNTCVVRQSAEDKAIGRLQSLKPLKRKNPDLVINLMGCLVGIKGQQNRLKQRFPFVDVFSPPSDYEPLLDYLAEREGLDLEQETRQERYALMDSELLLPRQSQGKMVAGYIPIVLGCSHACTYCVIPSRRGTERSRPVDVILREARSLTAQGVREITLLGQIVDRYGKDDTEFPSLAQLLRWLHEIEGVERLRFLTSHPNWMTDELLDAVAELPKVMPHVEVPVQSGDDEVLANMRRGYTANQYRVLVEHIRDRIPQVAIATDVIVGFPGESEAQFHNTYNLLQELKLDVAHLARYSPRPGTISATRMQDDVPDAEKWRRFRALEDLQAEIAAKINATYLGQTTEVLFEGQRKGRWQGRTPTNKIVFVETDHDLMGAVAPVEITWTGPWSMQARLVKDA